MLHIESPMLYYSKVLVSKKEPTVMENTNLKMGDAEKMKKASKNFTQLIKQPASKKISEFLKEQGQKEKSQPEKQSAIPSKDINI